VNFGRNGFIKLTQYNIDVNKDSTTPPPTTTTPSPANSSNHLAEFTPHGKNAVEVNAALSFLPKFIH
jgi:hypothetical protein